MIKMRVCKDKHSVCDSCNCKFLETEEMYQIMIGEKCFCLCRKCSNILFTKQLKADCLYNSKLKSPEDINRIMRANAKKKF